MVNKKKPFILKKKRVPKVKAMKDGVKLKSVRVTDEEIIKVIASHAVLYVRMAAVKASYLGAPSIIRTVEFKNSLGYEIVQDSRGRYSFKLTLKYDDRWSWVCDYLESSGKPFPMKWLTKDQLKKTKTIPIKDKETGEIVFRTTPLTTKKAWIHPGIKKGMWIDEGIEKGIRRAMPTVSKMVKAKMIEGR